MCSEIRGRINYQRLNSGAFRRDGRMKGQFFIIGALFICILLFFATGLQIGITATGTDDMDHLSKNLQKELPHALNIGINSSNPLGVLYNFTIFSTQAMKTRRINLTCYWLVFQQGDGVVNVSAGNFLNSPKTFEITVSGISKELHVGPNSINSTTFSVSGYEFDVGINVDDESESMTLLANKTSIYSSLVLERAENVIKREIIG